jgi:hypothetical protein
MSQEIRSWEIQLSGKRGSRDESSHYNGFSDYAIDDPLQFALVRCCWRLQEKDEAWVDRSN